MRKSAPQIVLHIGRQKTGTTSIQRFFAANSEVLAEHGVLYPTTGRKRGSHSAHHELAVALNSTESTGDELLSLQQSFQRELEASQHDLIVFSSEAFQRLRSPERLQTFFGGARLQVVCYLRECLAAKQSSWAQAVHATGQSARFLDYALRARMQYRPFVTQWKRWSSELDLALFERNRLTGGDVVADFLSRIGRNELAQQMDRFPRDDGLPSLGGNLLHLRHVMNVARAGAPDLHGTFEALSALAASEPRWRGRWYVPDTDRAAIAKVDRDDQRFLESRFGSHGRVDFDALPMAPDSNTLAEDFRQILSDRIVGAGFSSFGLGPASSS